MMLLLTAIDDQNEHREFSTIAPSLEIGFDFLSGIVARGHRLLTAEIVDHDQRLKLPVDAFDGQPFSTMFQQLEGEWQQILDQPLPSCVSDVDWLTQLIRQRSDRQIDRILQLEGAIETYEQRLQYLQSVGDSVVKRSRELQRLEQIIKLYRRHLDKARVSYDSVALERLQLKISQE